jgi:hypothetical protein
MKQFFLMIICTNIFLNAELTKNSNEVISDSQTRLSWQDKYNEDVIKLATFQDALSYCEELILGGYSDWRLPNINELLSLTDHNRNSPAIDLIFTYRSSNFYLSSTTLVSDKDKIWGVNFIYGGSGLRTKSNENLVRCVRINNK